jgi:hypothetical protein
MRSEFVQPLTDAFCARTRKQVVESAAPPDKKRQTFANRLGALDWHLLNFTAFCGFAEIRD